MAAKDTYSYSSYFDGFRPPLPPHMVPVITALAARHFCLRLTQTIRGRILIAFLAMSMITAALGGYAALGIRRAGVLVTKTYDESLMSINYARAASADFADMQVAFARRWSATKPANPGQTRPDDVGSRRKPDGRPADRG